MLLCCPSTSHITQISILRNVTFLCPHVQSIDCILALGPVGCWFSVFGRDGTALQSPPPVGVSDGNGGPRGSQQPLQLTGAAEACGVVAWGR